MNQHPRLRDAEADAAVPSPGGRAEAAHSVLAALHAVHGNQELLGAMSSGLGASDLSGAGRGGAPPSLVGASFEHGAAQLGAEAFTPGLSLAPAGEVGVHAAPTVDGGDAQQVRVVERAVQGAKELAKEGIRRTELRNEEERAVASYNLRSESPEHMASTRSVLQRSLAGLGGEVTIDIDPVHYFWVREHALAYIGVFMGTRVTDIHVTPRFFKAAAGMRSWCILHEATHCFADTVDHKYYSGSLERPELTTDQALENADSVAAFAYGHLRGSGIDQLREAQRAWAKEHAAELFDGWAGGEIELYTDGWTAPDGLRIGAPIVAEAVFDHFRRERKDEYGEAALATATQEEGPFTCTSGLVVRRDLFEMVYAEEQGFERWQ